jgi:hypothetical protein
MIDETLGDLAEARAKIEGARRALQDAQGGDFDQVRAAIGRLERIEAEVAWVERVIEGQTVTVRRSYAEHTSLNVNRPGTG